MKNELPKRKTLRLEEHNYSTAGAYFVTICIQDRQQILSDIGMSTAKTSVGDGAPDVPHVRLTPLGRIIEKHLLASEKIPGVKIDQYVIMPDHMHAIIIIEPTEDISAELFGGTSRAPSPTNEMLPRVVGAFKRFCNKEIGYNIFQRSYIEHIIRDRDDYHTRLKYIYENPIRWYYRNLQTDK